MPMLMPCRRAMRRLRYICRYIAHDTRRCCYAQRMLQRASARRAKRAQRERQMFAP